MNKKFWIRKALMITTFVILGVLVFGAIVMALWNAILPAVIGVKSVTYLQALGILVLSKILFGGFRGGGGFAKQKRERWMAMQQKMASMTPEEREQFKNEWRNRCGHWRKGTNNAGVKAD